MKQAQLVRVQLGEFELDLRTGELRSADATTLLREQPLQVLRLLVEADGELISREDIRKKLWPNDTIVEFDHSINAAIKNLRRALGDSADEPRYIETLARRGYRLMVPVERVSTGDSLRRDHRQRPHAVEAGPQSETRSGRQDRLPLSRAGGHRRRRHGTDLSRRRPEAGARGGSEISSAGVGSEPERWTASSAKPVPPHHSIIPTSAPSTNLGNTRAAVHRDAAAEGAESYVSVWRVLSADDEADAA